MIQYFLASKTPNEKPVFSIIVPTWNNLALVQLCVKSILKNSTYPHQIVLHVNNGNDGTLEWVREQGLDYTYSDANVGICLACNAAYSLTKADYILYLNDDMYVCPEWDTKIFEAIQQYGKDDFYFSGTLIERDGTGYNCVSSPHHFGTNPADFQEDKLLAEYKRCIIADWQGANYPPSIMHRRMWDLIGGFSVDFSPGMYSDPDISMKLWQVGVRNFRGIGSSLVYHFMGKSTERVVKNDGHKQFIRKWGISAHAFFANYTKLLNHKNGLLYQGVLQEPEATWTLTFQRFLARLKMW